MLTLSQIKRKGYFFYYLIKPFRLSLISRHLVGRTASSLGLKHGFRVIDLSVTNDCNLHCEHCSAALFNDPATPLSLEDYQHIVEQSGCLDNLSWNITGGEPLLVDWLDELIPILEPARHYISIQTNCCMLTQKRARRLSALGVNCITTSLDSMDEKRHDQFRGYEGAYRKTLEGIRNAKAAGMQVLIGGVVTHENLFSHDLEKLIEKSNSLGAIFLFNLAVPCGRWKDRPEVILTGKDRKHLQNLLDRYPMSSTDHEVGRNRIGCPAGMEKIYITTTGEVLPCPFIPVSFGNCRQEALLKIVKRMRQMPEFGDYQPICVAAEDEVFQANVLSKISRHETKAYPISWLDIYGKMVGPRKSGRTGE